MGKFKKYCGLLKLVGPLPRPIGFLLGLQSFRLAFTSRRLVARRKGCEGFLQYGLAKRHVWFRRAKAYLLGGQTYGFARQKVWFGNAKGYVISSG